MNLRSRVPQGQRPERRYGGGVSERLLRYLFIAPNTFRNKVYCIFKYFQLLYGYAYQYLYFIDSD